MKSGDTAQWDVTVNGIYEIELTFHDTNLPSIAITTFAFLNEEGAAFQHFCVCFPYSKKYQAYYRYAYVKKHLEKITIGPILIPPGCAQMTVGIFDHAKNVDLVSCDVRLVPVSLKTAHSTALLAASEEGNIAFLSLLEDRQIKNADKQFVYNVVNHYGSTRNRSLIAILLAKFGAGFYFDSKAYASFCRLKSEFKAEGFLSRRAGLLMRKEDRIDVDARKRLKVSLIAADEHSTITDVQEGRFIFSLIAENGEEHNLAESLASYAAGEVNIVDRRGLDSLKQIELLAAIVYGYLRSCKLETIRAVAAEKDSSSLTLVNFLARYAHGNR